MKIKKMSREYSGRIFTDNAKIPNRRVLEVWFSKRNPSGVCFQTKENESESSYGIMLERVEIKKLIKFLEHSFKVNVGEEK